MDRVSTLIGYEWQAYKRRFFRAGLRAGNQGIVLIFSVLIATKYFQLLQRASAEIASGNARLLVQLLTALFLAWLFPLASNGRASLASSKWLHLPLTLWERFLIRSISLVMPPAVWLVIAASVGICYPLAQARSPGAAIVAGFLFIAMAWLTGLTISHLLNSVVWRRFFVAAACALLAAAGLYVLGGGALSDLLAFPFSPTRLVERTAMGEGGITSLTPLGTLVVCSASAGVAALWSLKNSLAAIPVSGTKKISILSAHILPGRVGGLVGKDFRYFRRLLDTYLGLATALLGCLYLLVADAPSTGILMSFIVVVFLCNGALAFNSFGLDNRMGLDRYGLLPLSGRAVLVSKNLAYLMIAGSHLAPMLIIAGWRLGILSSVLGLIEAATIACAYLAWGNWMSVNHPLKMQFFRFANSGAALVDAMGGIVFGSLPGILMISLWRRPGSSMAAGTALILLLTGTLYLASVTRFGRRLEQKRERLAEALG